MSFEQSECAQGPSYIINTGRHKVLLQKISVPPPKKVFNLNNPPLQEFYFILPYINVGF